MATFGTGLRPLSLLLLSLGTIWKKEVRLKEGKRPVVCVEHHLLRLARIRPYKQHSAVAQPDLRHFHRHRGAIDHHNLVAGAKISRLVRLTPPCSALLGIRAPEADV
jgi:hypothetical protein